MRNGKENKKTEIAAYPALNENAFVRTKGPNIKEFCALTLRTTANTKTTTINYLNVFSIA